MKLNKLLCFLCCFCLLSVFHVRVDASIGVSAEAAVLMCADNGEVVYAVNEHKQLSMASTTKIMTSLLVLEERTPFREVNVTKQMVSIEGTSMGLLPGDTVNFDALVHGMLLASGNDAANTAALVVGGSAENFAVMMNRRAKEIGMDNTNFVTASGLDDEEHYSTAFDMALLACEALENPEFRSICAKKSASLCYGNPPYSRTLTNHNRLLWSYSHAIGVKTGFTKKSGRCLVSAAERDGITLVAVTLNDRDDWNDHINMFEYGFSQVKKSEIFPDLSSVLLPIVGGDAAGVAVEVGGIPAIVSDYPVEYNVYLRRFEYAPVVAGECVGYVEYVSNGEVCGHSSIVAAQDAHVEENVEVSESLETEQDKQNVFERVINRIKSVCISLFCGD